MKPATVKRDWLKAYSNCPNDPAPIRTYTRSRFRTAERISYADVPEIASVPREQHGGASGSDARKVVNVDVAPAWLDR